jgi:hypothetical protein
MRRKLSRLQSPRILPCCLAPLCNARERTAGPPCRASPSPFGSSPVDLVGYGKMMRFAADGVREGFSREPLAPLHFPLIAPVAAKGMSNPSAYYSVVKPIQPS